MTSNYCYDHMTGKEKNIRHGRDTEVRSTESHLTSTSGLLCLSTFWDGKFLRHVAAISVARTASRYGFSAPLEADYESYIKVISKIVFDSYYLESTHSL